MTAVEHHRVKRRMWNSRHVQEIVLMSVMAASLAGCRTLPPGVHVTSRRFAVAPGEARLLIDRTAWDPALKQRVMEHEIFDALLAMIAKAESVIVLDLFLWNQMGAGPNPHRPLAGQLVDALLKREAEAPGVEILVMTDPINALYAAAWDPQLQRLREAGIPVVLTDLDRLRESNLVYAPAARAVSWFLHWLPLPSGWIDRARMTNPFDADASRISLRQLGRLLYFKANHRKVAIVNEADGGWCALVTSLNPHDASSAHANIGLQLNGPIVLDALMSELACMEWSLDTFNQIDMRTEAAQAIRCVRTAARQAPLKASDATPASATVTAQWLTERAIRDALIDLCDRSGQGDTLRAAVFYLSERRVIAAIRGAAQRGANVRIILDPNRDAFGRRKNGVPNRVVARELTRFAERRDLAISVRWADTHGEQFHTKALCVRDRSGNGALLCGSANWTRRNLNNLNMEANALIENDRATLDRFCNYFDRAWTNSDGLHHTLPYPVYAEGWWKCLWKGVLYRVGEHLGASTF